VRILGLDIPLGWAASPITSRIAPTTEVRILRGPARGMRWLAGSGPPNFYLGTYEREKAHLFAEAVKMGMTVYDIGANAGYYSLIAARRTQAGVYAFEPFPVNHQRIVEHVKRNRLSNITAIAAAVGATDGMAHFQSGRTLCEGRVSGDGDLTVAALRLDTFVRSHPVPDLVKIDVEGGEVDVLLGGESVIQRRRPILFVATHSPDLDAASRHVLGSFGYSVRELEPGELLATPAR